MITPTWESDTVEKSFNLQDDDCRKHGTTTPLLWLLRFINVKDPVALSSAEAECYGSSTTIYFDSKSAIVMGESIKI
jgi:hypothetical protein